MRKHSKSDFIAAHPVCGQDVALRLARLAARIAYPHKNGHYQR
jgi:hypothetical protein